MKLVREYMTSYHITWSIIAVPSIPWAKKVFPHLEEGEAVSALWDAIFKASRADQENPILTWHDHNTILLTKRTSLNQKQYKKMYSYQGNLIENFTLTFENGSIVDYQAEQGYETLKSMIEMDEGAHYLGEIALVPHHSPISKSNLIFFNTLFDENASNHLALGKAFPTCIEGGTSMSQEELEKAGLNDSLIHVDFMIGSSEMDIDGEHADGTLESIFRKGNWAF